MSNSIETMIIDRLVILENDIKVLDKILKNLVSRKEVEQLLIVQSSQIVEQATKLIELENKIKRLETLLKASG